MFENVIKRQKMKSFLPHGVKLPRAIKLTNQEIDELISYCEKWHSRDPSTYLLEDEKRLRITVTSANKGIHYVASQDWFYLEQLLENPKLPFETMIQLIRADKSASRVGKVLSNLALRKDVEKFETIWKLLNEDNWGTKFSCLKFKVLEELDIEIIMFLIDEWMKVEEPEKSSSTQQLRLYMMVLLRKDDISAWFEKNYPALADLPYSGIMHTYGLKNWNESIKDSFDLSKDYV